METSEFEFLLSQYLDGTLGATQAAEVEERLASDASARKLLEQYRKLDAGLQALPLPAIQWDKLAKEISRSLDAPAEEPESYPMPWVRHALTLHRVSRWAVAAAVVLAFGFGIRMYLAHRGAVPPLGQQVAIIVGPQAEAAAGSAVCSIEVGPSGAARNVADSNVFDTPGASRVVIASGANSEQDVLQQLSN